MTARSQYGPYAERAADAAPAASPYTASGVPVDLAAPYRGETYYGIPPIRSSHYGWLIVAYFFVGGLASAAQFIATIADLAGGQRDRGIVRAGRYIALAGALVSPVLLIADLQTPRRWYNMVRIYRGTSAMSIGSWALSTFGILSGLTAVSQALEDLGLSAARMLARLFQFPAALAGGIVALYTGTLMAAMNLPFVAAAFPYLSSLFASSAASSAAASLSLVAEATAAPRGTRRSLNQVAIVTGLSELIFALLVRRGWQRRGAMAPMQDPAVAVGYRLGVLGLGIGVPLVVHAAEEIGGRRSGLLTVLADTAALVGCFVLRAVFVFGGNESGRHPDAYFRLTAPGDGAAWGGGAHGRE